ncbi:MAG: ribonuclease T2 family protein [Pseudorhodobacter sp.]
MRELFLAAGIMALTMGMARAEGERAGVFDYYVMALSWSATWCALEGDARKADQCRAGGGFDFTLHGLWPQNERGWPSWCRTVARDPSRQESAAMADIMGSAGLAWHQWKKHGRCSGMSGRDYYAFSRRALDTVTIPPLFARITQDLELPANVVEEAFLEANPGLDADMVTVTCKSGMIQEVRICLTRDLKPRRCGADVIRDCSLNRAELQAVR